MSLQEDFARNRSVFERIISDFASAADSAGPYPARESQNLSGLARGVSDEYSASRNVYIYDESEKAPHQSFSLSRGTENYDVKPSIPEPFLAKSGGISRETAMKLSIDAIAENEYPPLMDIRVQTTDPIEKLYHQLEVEARQASQLSREEDLF